MGTIGDTSQRTFWRQHSEGSRFSCSKRWKVRAEYGLCRGYFSCEDQIEEWSLFEITP